MRIIRSLQTMRYVTANLLSDIGLLALLTAAVVSCGGQQKDTSSDSGMSALSAAADSVVIALVGEDSVSVLELLQHNHEVISKSSVMGEFVTAVDSLKSGASVFWIYTVNDSIPAVACDRFLTSDGDTVRWHFRKSAP
jgi:hypothetical protein